jgi:hypothetical protein
MSLAFTDVKLGDKLTLPKLALNFNVIEKTAEVVVLEHERGGVARFYRPEFDAEGFERIEKKTK